MISPARRNHKSLFSRPLRLKRLLERARDKKKRISHARAEAALETQSKAGGRDLIFISTEPVYMNNKLPRRGEILFITALRSNEKNDFSSQRPPPALLNA